MNINELKNEIHHLPLREQAILLDELWLSLNPVSCLSSSQKSILDNRYEQFESGELTTIASEKAHKRLRDTYL